MQKAKNHKFVALRRHVGATLRSRLGAASVLGVSSLLLWAAGCSGDIEESSAPKQTTDALRTEDLASLSPLERIEKLAAPRVPVNVLYSATIGENGEALDVSSQVLPGAEAVEPPPELPPASAERLPLPQRISPALSEAVEGVKRGVAFDRDVDVVVTFVEDLALPKFPEPRERESRDSAYNKQARDHARLLADAVAQLRGPRYDRKLAELQRTLGAKERSRFWLINGLALSLPLSKVTELAARDDVQYVELEQTDVPPPMNDIVDGRAIIQSDPYFGFTGGWIGLLDTGVRNTHTLLATPSNLAFQRDCVNGTSVHCSLGVGLDPDDDCWDHGTASASIISGNNNLGNTSRGVTPIALDSWKVYGTGCGGYNSASGVRAFEAAVAVLDRVIVGEIQSPTSHTDATSTAANNAYAAGAVVVAAAGNYGPDPGSVASPGNAHRALAVGAMDVVNQSLQYYSGRGPTTDGRVKPDIVAPTNTRAARTTSDTALFAFGGTSGATPYGAGAAAFARNFLRQGNTDIDPGFVNAFTILAGDLYVTGNNDWGGGIVQLPLNSAVWWGSATVSHNQDIDIPINVGTPTQRVAAVIWWPDPTTGPHNRVSLRLIRPDSVGSTANHATSVWQKIAWNSTDSGTWTVRIRGENVTGSQLVYYVLVRT